MSGHFQVSRFGSTFFLLLVHVAVVGIILIIHSGRGFTGNPALRFDTCSKFWTLFAFRGKLSTEVNQKKIELE